MTIDISQQFIRRAILTAWLSATILISLSITGCGKSNPQNIRANPAPLQFEFPYQVMGFSHAVFGGDNFQMFEGAHLHYIVLEGVDSPKPGQQFYIESRDALTSLLDKQSIELRIIRCDPDYREIGFAYLEDAPASAAPHRLANPPRTKTETNHEIDSAADPTDNSDQTLGGKLDVGHEIIRLGFGWYDGTEFVGADLYRTAQEEAQAAKRGLWIQENPLAPWDHEANEK